MPVTNPEARELAKKIAAPISSDASPKRLIGVCARIDAARGVGDPSGLKRRDRFCSAGKKPGVIVLTRTPLGAHSRAKNWLTLTTAAFAAE